MSIERARVVIFLLCLATFGVVCLGVGIALGKEYQTSTQEALLIRPERPVQRVKPPAPCLTPPERPKRIVWQVRAKDGAVIIIGAIDVRQRC